MEEENEQVRSSPSHQILQTMEGEAIVIGEHTQTLFLSYGLFYITCATSITNSHL